MKSAQSIPDPLQLDPLSVCSERFATAWEEAGSSGGYIGGMERYRKLYRTCATEQNKLTVVTPTIGRVQESESGEGVVRKFTIGLGAASAGVYDKGVPGVTVETESVIIPMIGKKRVRTHTLCVSSQVGCAMGCGFCQTAQMGLVRNLTVREIVGQWWAARWDVQHEMMDEGFEGEKKDAVAAPVLQDGPRKGCDTIRNVVFMGMGEPMDNLEAVIGAIAVLTDRNGPNVPMSKVTISTVGRVDGITRLAEQVHLPGWHRLNLAVSLNAPTDAIRETIMPINRRYSMNELRSAIERWPIYGAAKICLEYVMIPGVNDAPEHAALLGDYVLGRGQWAGRPPLPGLVNLIPYNPREGSPWAAPVETKVDEFLALLTVTGVYAKRRRTKGRDQMAACGQLGNLEFRRKHRAAIHVTVGGRSSGEG